MFRFFTFILLITEIIPAFTNAQEKTIYYNSNRKTTKDSASYVRTAELLQSGEYYVQDHYMNGRLRMTGYYTRPSLVDSCQTGNAVYYDSAGNVEDEGNYNKGMHTGIWKYYYPHSTNLRMEEIFQADTSPAICIYYDSILQHKVKTGHILNGKKTGVFQEYYVFNGLLKATLSYKEDMKEGLYSEYDIQTHTPIMKGAYLHDKKIGTWGYYTPTGDTYLVMNFEDDLPEGPATFYNTFSQKKWKEYNFHDGKRAGHAYIYFANGNLGAVLNYKDDSLDGDQKYYYPSGITKRVDHYNNGTVVNGKCFNGQGNSIPYFLLPSDDQIAIRTIPFHNGPVYSQNEDGTRMPMPSVNINYFINGNLHYPIKARDNNIQGRVVLKFIVLKDGSISDIHVLRGIGGGCDEEAIRVLKLMPKWKPGINKGKPVDVYYTMPISFKLQ